MEQVPGASEIGFNGFTGTGETFAVAFLLEEGVEGIDEIGGGFADDELFATHQLEEEVFGGIVEQRVARVVGVAEESGALGKIGKSGAQFGQVGGL